ncbi:right-handed parallel beta-helix repeat-containing protein [Sulfitobacter sp. 915]|uniref:right-handed parallel beta-helix repeat-containing protein n=1 Tax=Sulfitobacter sp. 915 TaxID=3368558 RepID=UPI003747771A
MPAQEYKINVTADDGDVDAMRSLIDRFKPLAIQEATDQATAAATSAAQAALYDGPKVDTFAELTSVTPEMLAVGEYIRCISGGWVYQREPEVVANPHLNYTGSGGVKLRVLPGVSGTNIMAFGLLGDDSTDDSTACLAALSSGIKDIYVPEGTFFVENVQATVTGLRLHGPGTFRFGVKGVALIGALNTVEGVTFKRATKTTNPSMNYVNHGLMLSGDYCTARDVEAFNCDGPGIIIDNSHFSRLDNVRSHDNIVGVLASASTRSLSLTGCKLIDNNVNAESGADGLLCSRSVTGLYLTDNIITGNGEHGVYFQGQDFMAKGNDVSRNGSDGIKFGSYDDGLYTYPGETLDRWVDGTGYGIRRVIISDNIIRDNGGGDGVYIQPSSREVSISGNHLRNNAITVVYFNYTGGSARLEDQLIFDVSRNRLEGSGADISIACRAGLIIGDNKLDGEIVVSAPNSSTEPWLSATNVKPKILRNEGLSNPGFSRLSLNRSLNAVIKSNDMVDLSVASNCSGARIIDNDITGLTTSLDTARVSEFSDNDVVVVGDIQFNDSAIAYSFPPIFTRNKIVGADYTGSYFVGSSFNANLPQYGDFSHNRIECTSCGRPVKIEGAFCSVVANTLIGDAAADYGFDCYGDDIVISSNILPGMTINLRNDTRNIAIGNKCDGVSGATGTNVAANNT